MRPLTPILMSAMLALSLSGAGITQAETPDSQASTEPGQFTEATAAQLQDAFERSASLTLFERLQQSGAPTVMNCNAMTSTNHSEVCIVTPLGAPVQAITAAMLRN